MCQFRGAINSAAGSAAPGTIVQIVKERKEKNIVIITPAGGRSVQSGKMLSLKNGVELLHAYAATPQVQLPIVTICGGNGGKIYAGLSNRAIFQSDNKFSDRILPAKKRSKSAKSLAVAQQFQGLNCFLRMRFLQIVCLF